MKELLMLPKDSFLNKTYIVTGGATGLGKSMTEALLLLGANVVIASRKEDKLIKACDELSSKTNSSSISFAICDVRKYDEIERLILTSIERHGSIDGVINSAAGNFITPTEMLSPNGFDTIVDIVLRGSYNMSLALGKYWISKKIKGNILNIVTTYAESGSGFVVPSATAKAGVVALTKSLASEWGKYGIRTNAVAPGPFPTDGAWDRLMPKEVRSLYSVEDRIPLKRVGKHEELANLATYLLSDYSAYVTGAVFTIDGGEYNFGAGEFNFLNSLSIDMWQQIEKTIRTNTKSS